MANNHSQACFSIPIVKQNPDQVRARIDALRTWVTEDVPFPGQLFRGRVEFVKRKLRDAKKEECWSLDFTVEPNRLYLSHDESIDMELAVAVAQVMLDIEGDQDLYTAEWADTCDKARVDQFGGGAVAFNRRNSAWKTTGQMARDLGKELG